MGETLKTGTAVRAVPLRGPTELQQLQKRTSHQKLLDATYSAFAELSYAGTTIDDIVTRAQVNRSTFYRHFDSKFAVAKALFSQFWPRLFAEYDRLADADPSLAQIDAAIEQLIAFYRANRPLIYTLGQIPALEPEGSQWEDMVRLEIVERLGRHIPAFRKASSAAESTPELRIRARMCMYQFETGIFNLAFKSDPDGDALRRFVVAEFRRFIEEGAG